MTHPAAAPSGRWRAALAVLAATGLATATAPGHAQSGQEGRTAEAGLDSCTCAARSTCWRAPAATSRSRSVPTASCWWIPAIAEMSGPVLAAIRQVQAALAARETPVGFGSETRSELFALRAPPAPPKPIRYILNTHFHPDHTGGNDAIAGAGRTITGGNVAGDLVRRLPVGGGGRPRVGAAPDEPRRPLAALPRPADRRVLHAVLQARGPFQRRRHPAHSTCRPLTPTRDSLVWFRGSDVISTGDVFIQTGYPRIDLEAGGSINGIVDALNHILDLAFPEFRLEGGTMIVPGHGRLSRLVRRRVLPRHGDRSSATACRT